MSSPLFSDNKRWAKLGLAFMIVVTSGIYYNMNRSGEYAGLKSYGLYLEEKSGKSICLQNVKISRNDEQFLTITRHKAMKLLNLPESVQEDCTGDYAIKGKITNGNYMVVESIRRKKPRIVKLTCSVATALIICPLFFLFFRISSKGFFPRQIYTLNDRKSRMPQI